LQLEWDDSYKVGIDVIDKQHKVLFDRIEKMINNLKMDLGANADQALIKTEVEDMFYFLTDYFNTHFALEEKYHAKYNKDGLAEHKEIHKSLMEVLNEIKYDVFLKDNIDKALVNELKTQVLTLWVTHTGGEDQVLKEGLQRHQAEGDN